MIKIGGFDGCCPRYLHLDRVVTMLFVFEALNGCAVHSLKSDAWHPGRGSNPYSCVESAMSCQLDDRDL